MTLTRFVGVDQTGAARDGGRRAKPLPCAWLERRSGWVLSVVDEGAPATLRGLTLEVLDARGWTGPDTAVLVDAVLGLPAPCWERAGLSPGHAGLWALFGRAASHELDGRRFGRAVSAAFFEALEVEGALLREVDRLVGAWSLFRQVPWQRDVQTGTHRIWRDLAAHGATPWLDVWPFARGGARATLVETWPSLAWRALLGQATRRPERLPELLPEGISLSPGSAEVLRRSPDHADAAVAALAGWWCSEHGWPWVPPERDVAPHAGTGEGWIALVG